MKYKLDNIHCSEIKELEKKVREGSKFVVFNYRIGLGFVSLLRVSPAIFIREKSEALQFKKKYNWYNLIFGPWYFFKGPWLTYHAYKVNSNGGIDVTNDIMLNITEQSLLEKEVSITKIHDIFIELTNSDVQNIKKALGAIDKKIIQIEKAYAGIFINVEEHVEPYFVIGFKLNKNSRLEEELIKKSLNTYYYKHVRFEFFDIEKEIQLGEKIIEQGNLVFGN
jgi:hypothetical protein